MGVYEHLLPGKKNALTPEAVQMLQEINDDSLLEFFYRFIARVLKNRGY